MKIFNRKWWTITIPEDGAYGPHMVSACVKCLIGGRYKSYPDLPNDETWLDVLNEYLVKKKGYYLVNMMSDDPGRHIRGHYIALFDNPALSILQPIIYKEGKMVHNPIKGPYQVRGKIQSYLILAKVVK